jgi:hypothetical protein
LPHNPTAARNLLTSLEAEEQAEAQEDALDQADSPRF